jgi:hypothetical protein
VIIRLLITSGCVFIIGMMNSTLQTGNTKKGLAEAAKLHPNTLQGVEDASWNPSYDTLVALEPCVACHGRRAA